MSDSDFADVEFIFVVWSDSAEYTESSLKEINFRYPVYIDTNGRFANSNTFLHSPIYNTVLVDHANRILLLGDLRGNQQLTELYKQRVAEQVANTE